MYGTGTNRAVGKSNDNAEVKPPVMQLLVITTRISLLSEDTEDHIQFDI
jgi:hypothetical protein